MFDRGYPYVWGDSVSASNYLDYLKDVEVGDIIVAGDRSNVRSIGKVVAKPVYLFEGQEKRDWTFEEYGIQKVDSTTLETFVPFESEYHDVVCVHTEWFDVDCSGCRMPVQVGGGFRPVNDAGKAYIEAKINRKPPQSTAVNPLLSFTALDFETGSGLRSSVCQVGLVRVVNGVIVEEYCGLIQPPNNFIREDFSDKIHHIYPHHTKNAPNFAASYPLWKHLIEGKTLVAHNTAFDLSCLKACLREFCGLETEYTTYCTMKTWKGAFENAQLATCCAELGVDLGNHHNALADARACAELFILAVEQRRKLRS